MKRFLLITLTLMAVAFAVTPAEAARRARNSNRPQRNGVFARLMELERQKNAAIRSWFSR